MSSPVRARLYAYIVAAALAVAPAGRARADDLHGPNIDLERVGPDLYRATFRVAAGDGVAASDVRLVGTVRPNALDGVPMKLDEATGQFAANLHLRGGSYWYQFQFAGKRIEPDPVNPLREERPGQPARSLLRVGPLAAIREARARAGDGRLIAEALAHYPELPLYVSATAEGKLRLRLLTAKGDASTVALLRPTAGGLSWGAYPMERAHQDSRFDFYEALLAMPSDRRLSYAFQLTDAAAGFVLDAEGVTRGSDKPAAPFQFDAAQLPPPPPAWSADTNWYYIVLDRFANGDPDNDPDPVVPWGKAWRSQQPWEAASGQAFYEHYVYDRFYGGDLAGVIAKLPYLQGLGISGIIISPPFRALSADGRDIVDFAHVDPRYGLVPKPQTMETPLAPPIETSPELLSDGILIELIAAAHQVGIRVAIDLSPRFVGLEHPAASDVTTHGVDSSFASWFELNATKPHVSGPHANWARLATAHGDAPPAALEDHFAAIVRHWMDPNEDGSPSDGVDGWMIEGCDRVDGEFLRRLAGVVRRTNPAALLMGDWRADPGAALTADGLHAVTGYRQAALASGFFIRAGEAGALTPSQFDEKLGLLRLATPDLLAPSQLSLLATADTDRALSMALNAANAYDQGNSIRRDGTSYDIARPGERARRKVRLAMAFLATYIGAPMIYYGEEAGMFGADDPDNRAPMWWSGAEYESPDDGIDAALFDSYNRVLAIRNTWSVFRQGDYRPLIADDRTGVWGFARQGAEGAAVVLFNVSNEERSPIVSVDGLRDTIGPVKQWMEVLNQKGALLVNQRAPSGSSFRRGLRIDNPVLTHTRVDVAIEATLPPLSAAIFVSALE